MSGLEIGSSELDGSLVGSFAGCEGSEEGCEEGSLAGCEGSEEGCEEGSLAGCPLGSLVG